MGRTNPTYRDQVRREREHWDQYRRALRLKSQERFDHLWDEAQNHSMAGGAMPHHDPKPTLFMGMFLAQQKEIEELRDRVADLE